jgi:hypothetical protein
MTLREQAVEAWRLEQEGQEERNRQRRAERVCKINLVARTRLGIELDANAQADGLTFDLNDYGVLCLVKNCEVCGAQLMSLKIESMADIGGQIAIPHWRFHECTQPAQVVITADDPAYKLALAIGEYMEAMRDEYDTQD